ncbi:MAG TPA: glycoside hydrolase family 31 protein [Terriglobales bacterium]|jgi:alpha-glucosidase
MNNGVDVTVGTAHVRITAVTPAIVRVRVSQNGAVPDKTISWAVDPKFKPEDVAVQLSDEDAGRAGLITLTLPGGNKVQVRKDPLLISFVDAQGNVVNEDAEPMSFDGEAFRVTKRMPADASELYYGLGDKTTLTLNDRAFTLWNTDAYGWQEATDPLYKAIPFYMAMRNGRGYGVFMDNTWRSSFDFGKARHDEMSFGAEGGELNYYFFFGPDPKQVMTNYTALTGRSPLPPLWAFGFQQSRYSYYPESEVRDIAKKFREKKIPADVIYLDIDYQDKNFPFTIDRQRFPHFEQMIQDLRKDGFSVVAITDLHIAKADYPPYNSGAKQDAFVKNRDGSTFVGPVWPGPSVFPDFTLTRARDWWGELYADFVKMGVRGFWNDMNEPSVFKTPTKTMPLDVVHRLDDGTTLQHLAAHNIVGEQNSRATYEGLVKLETPMNERPFVLTRATYAGGQRFAATWTGDNSATFNHLRMSIPTLLNLGISGIPFTGDDIGGFRGTAPPELVTRWMELGVFNPIYRNHSEKGSGHKEPWSFGQPFEEYSQESIEQRYRLLPYIYSAAEEASRTGIPMMRPMFMEFPNDVSLAGNQEEFMFGPSLLVAPRVWEFKQPYSVQLPAGIWYDYWNGNQYRSEVKKTASATAPEGSAGLTLEVNPPYEQVPVYVRGGSIIPHQPVVQSTAFTPEGNLQLQVYPGPDCKGQMYMDDGHSLNVGMNHMHLVMSCAADAHIATLTIDPQHGQWKPWFSKLDVVFYGAPNAPKSASVNGQAIAEPEWDPSRHRVTVSVPFVNTGEKVEISY